MKLPSDAPLATRVDQLLKASSNALLHVELAAKQLEAIRASLDPRVQFVRRADRADENVAEEERLFDSVSSLGIEVYFTLIAAARAIEDAVQEEEEEGEEEGE